MASAIEVKRDDQVVLREEIVDYDDPAWDSVDRWELGPPIPREAVLVPFDTEEEECPE